MTCTKENTTLLYQAVFPLIRVKRTNRDAPPSGDSTENSDFFWYDYTEKLITKRVIQTVRCLV